MNRGFGFNDNPVETDLSGDFPLRRLYFAIIAVLTFLSVVGISIQSDSAAAPAWRVAAEIKVTSITLILLLLGWLPLLLPWLARVSPRIQQFFIGLRQGGIEEIEAGILRIKLGPRVEKALATYQDQVTDPSKSVTPSKKMAEDLEKIYQDTLGAIHQAGKLNPQDAIKRIDQLGEYFNRLRENMPSSPTRTQLMTNIASIMFSLMPSVEDFPVQDRINSPDAGQRLSAYKYIESKPDPGCFDLLSSRAMGILEVPFTQYHALLALRRLVITASIPSDQKALISQMLVWSAALPYTGRDRRALMMNVSELLKRAELPAN